MSGRELGMLSYELAFDSVSKHGIRRSVDWWTHKGSIACAVLSRSNNQFFLFPLSRCLCLSCVPVQGCLRRREGTDRRSRQVPRRWAITQGRPSWPGGHHRQVSAREAGPLPCLRVMGLFCRQDFEELDPSSVRNTMKRSSFITFVPASVMSRRVCSLFFLKGLI